MPTNSSQQIIKVGLIQMACTPDIEKNLDACTLHVRDAAQQGAQIICLQELFRSPYFCQTEDTGQFSLAEEIPGPSTEHFSKLAEELEVVLILPLFEKRSAGLYHNTAVVIDADGSLLGKYRKMHIPDDPGFYEKFYFTPGDTGFKAFQTRYGKIGVLICWDQWFPEAARLTALSGAQIIFYPTAIGFGEADRSIADKQASAWQTIQRGHAIANGVFLAAVNRVGPEEGITFWGQSFLSDPFGGIIVEASKDHAQILIADCDLNLVEQTRQNWPFLRDRRIDAYQPLTTLYDDSTDD